MTECLAPFLSPPAAPGLAAEGRPVPAFAEELSAGAVASATAELGRAPCRAAGWAAGWQPPRAADAPRGTAECLGIGTGAHARRGDSHHYEDSSSFTGVVSHSG